MNSPAPKSALLQEALLGLGSIYPVSPPPPAVGCISEASSPASSFSTSWEGMNEEQAMSFLKDETQNLYTWLLSHLMAEIFIAGPPTVERKARKCEKVTFARQPRAQLKLHGFCYPKGEGENGWWNPLPGVHRAAMETTVVSWTPGCFYLWETSSFCAPLSKKSTMLLKPWAPCFLISGIVGHLPIGRF